MINIIKQTFLLIIKLLYESGNYSLYTYNGTLITNQTSSYKIMEYRNYSEIPKFITKKIFKYPFLSLLYYRLNSKNARLICIDTGIELIAYGWIQSWKPFKRKFGWVFKNAIMLGPYWTNEKFRGRGIYGDLLKYSLANIPSNIPVLIYTVLSNVSSQKGIEKNGFEKIGNFRICLFFRTFSIYRKIK